MNSFVKNHITFLILVVYILISASLFAQETVISKKIKTSRPENLFISIINKSDSISKFSFTLNEKFYGTNDEIKNEIFRMANKNKDSLYYYAWKFVCNNSYNFNSIIKDNWSTTPTLFVNSLGIGLCGKQAIVLSKIWMALGYKTQIWGLNGHIVPEVFINNKWHMLDPAFRIYFLNDSNEIASIKELEEKPELITNPKTKLKNDAYSFLRYSKKYANFLTTKEDNNLTYTEVIPDETTNFIIELPPSLIFEFPGIFSRSIKTSENTNVPYYSNCRIKIPPRWKGKINNNLILCDIFGNGKVKINNIEYFVNDSSLFNKITKYDTFIKDIEIGEHTDTIELIYLINPLLSEIQKENSIQIKGKNINKLQIRNYYLPDSISILYKLKKQYFFYDNSRINYISKLLNSNTSCLKNNNLSKANFIDNLTEYYNCTKAGNETEIKDITNKIETCFNNLPNDYNYNKLFYIINNIQKEIIFDDFKNASDKEIFSILTSINKKD